MLTPAAADEFKLPLRAAPFGLAVVGIGGDVQIRLTTVDVLTLADTPLRRVDFLVGGSEPGAGAAGVLRQNVLRLGDVEYDFANGAIRLMRASDCKTAVLAYWAKSQPYSVIDVATASRQQLQTTATAFINGARIRVQFDTGAQASVVSLRAAERAGVRPGALTDLGAADATAPRSAIRILVSAKCARPSPSTTCGSGRIRWIHPCPNS